MSTLCDICQRPIANYVMPTDKGLCTCDCRDRFTWGLKQEIVRLKALVRSAYEEGADDILRGLEGEFHTANWEGSEAKKELEKG